MNFQHKELLAFCEDYHPDLALVVCFVPRKRIITVGRTKIQTLPWRD
ncbi:MAG: hypothetical protein JO149_03130, partial [Gammaproteobacteria bacterium]|nr:hypothetical protein [Gammaproteobacteria bacterium]